MVCFRYVGRCFDRLESRFKCLMYDISTFIYLVSLWKCRIHPHGAGYAKLLLPRLIFLSRGWNSIAVIYSRYRVLDLLKVVKNKYNIFSKWRFNGDLQYLAVVEYVTHHLQQIQGVRKKKTVFSTGSSKDSITQMSYR